MGEAIMKVKLISHTQLSDEFVAELSCEGMFPNGRQAVALTAIRTCYSPNEPSSVVKTEGQKYFNETASDGEVGKEADRLIRHIMRSKHLSTVEHLSYTFAIEGVSRALLAQLTRHRVGFSFSVQSQRYVRMGSGDKSGGFDYVVPPSIRDKGPGATAVFKASMAALQQDYDALRKLGVPAEDARMVLPNAAATNLTMTANLRAVLDFYGKRRRGRGAQWEIAELAEHLREAVVVVDPWTAPYFDVV